MMDFSVYPNPARDNVTICSKNELLKIELMDISGKIIRSLECFSGTETIDLIEISNGLYILKCKTTKGSFTEKIIKSGN